MNQQPNNYAAGRQEAERQPDALRPEQPTEPTPDQPERLAAAERAFVQLAAKDIESGRWPEGWSTSDIGQYFAELYVGSYPSLYDAACALTDLDALDRDIEELNTNYPTVQVHFNIDMSYEALRDCWDIVSDPDGAVHLFEK